MKKLNYKIQLELENMSFQRRGLNFYIKVKPVTDSPDK